MLTLFAPPDVDEMYARFKLNCGPCALAALLGRPVVSVRDWFPAYPLKPWCNLLGMCAALDAAGVPYQRCSPGGKNLPAKGLAFLQWEGPWLAPGVPIGAAYQRCHWIGVVGEMVYDVNAREWVPRTEWEADVIPHLIAHTPRATGWHTRAGIEVRTAARLKPNPCGCGACSVCGMYGLAPRPVVAPPTASPLQQAEAERKAAWKAKPKEPTLFDEVTS